MKLNSFIPPQFCRKYADRFKPVNGKIEIQIDDSLNELALSGDSANLLHESFVDAAESGGEYLCNIIRTFCVRFGVNENKFVEQI